MKSCFKLIPLSFLFFFFLFLLFFDLLFLSSSLFSDSFFRRPKKKQYTPNHRIPIPNTKIEFPMTVPATQPPLPNSKYSCVGDDAASGRFPNNKSCDPSTSSPQLF